MTSSLTPPTSGGTIAVSSASSSSLRRAATRWLAVVSALLLTLPRGAFAGPAPGVAEIDHAFTIFLNVKEHILHRCIYRPTAMEMLRGAQKQLAKELGPHYARSFAPLPGTDFDTAWPVFQRSLIKVASAPAMKLSLQALVEHSIRGYCSTLDRYADYDDLASWEAEEKLKRPDYSGVGMTLVRTPTGYECYPFPGAPADLAGADLGDRLIEVEGRPVRGLPMVEVGAMFIGKTGSKVQFKVEHLRASRVETLTATRDAIRASLIEVEKEVAGATVRLRWLNESTVTDLSAFLRTLDPGAALTLDLRGCHGGNLSSAIAVARLFLPNGAVIAKLQTLHAQEVFTSENRTPYRPGKLTILQDRGTMSGAELITLALVTSPEVHAESRGEKSFGKGVTISEDKIEGGGGRLRITDARIYGPQNEVWEGEGLLPSVETEAPPKL